MRRLLGLLGGLLAAATAASGSQQLPPSLLARDQLMAQLAAEAAARGPVQPYPLIGDRLRSFGGVYDQFVLGIAIGRARLAEGKPADAASIREHPAWSSRRTVVVAYPTDCEGRPNEPTAIRWITTVQTPGGGSLLVGGLKPGHEAGDAVPGVGLPLGALVATFQNAVDIGARVEIDYVNPVCGGAARTASLPLARQLNAEVVRPTTGLKVPEGLSVPSPSTVRLSVLIDGTGRIRDTQLEQGPEELRAAAVALIESKTFAPSTMNDVPVPLSAMMTFVFTTDGSYAAPAPFSRNPRPVEPGIKMVESTVAVQSAGPVSTSTSPPVPPAPPGLIPSQMARLAVESAAKGEPVPIPFDAAGPARHGVLFDAFRIAVLRARAARAGTGSPTAAESPAPPPPHMVAVAYPLTCGERQIKPIDVQIHAGAGVRGPVRTLSGLLPGDALASELPGATLPAGAVGRLLQVTAFSSSLEAHVTYAEPPCGASSAVVILPIQWVRGEARPNLTLTQLPKDSKLSSPTVVRLRGIVDLDGVYRFPTIAEGPPELEVAAAAVASQWRYVPYRANGVAVPQSLITTLTFRD